MYSFNDLKKYVNDIVISAPSRGGTYCIFGAGLIGYLSINKLKDLNIKYCIDNNSELWGGKCNGIEIISPNELYKLDNPYAIITVAPYNINAIRKQLTSMNIPFITYAEYSIKNDFNKYEKVFNMLYDDYSKSIYVNATMHHLLGESFEDIFIPDQYFCLPKLQDLYLFKEGVFVDCGAHVGKNSEIYINNSRGIVKKIYAFEPFEKSLVAYKHRMNRVCKEWNLDIESIVPIKALIGIKNDIQKLHVNDSSLENYNSQDVTNTVQVPQYSIDEYFQNLKYKPTYIKADVEGAELNMIIGAKNIIKNYSPMLGICLYHIFSDFYELPLKIYEINPEYKMFVRHHSSIHCETVLYCL